MFQAPIVISPLDVILARAVRDSIKDSLKNIHEYLEEISYKKYPELRNVLKENGLSPDEAEWMNKGKAFVEYFLVNLIKATVVQEILMSVLPFVTYNILRSSIDPKMFGKDVNNYRSQIKGFAVTNTKFLEIIYNVMGRFYYALLYPKKFLDIYGERKEEYSRELKVAYYFLEGETEKVYKILCKEIQEKVKSLGIKEPEISSNETFLGEYT